MVVSQMTAKTSTAAQPSAVATQGKRREAARDAPTTGRSETGNSI